MLKIISKKIFRLSLNGFRKPCLLLLFSGPSNNTGSTNLSAQQQQMYNPYLPRFQGPPQYATQGPPQYAQGPPQYQHFTPGHTPVRYQYAPSPSRGPYTPTMAQISSGAPQNIIVGAYGNQGGQMFHPQGSGPPSHCGTPSVASLQMV